MPICEHEQHSPSNDRVELMAIRRRLIRIQDEALLMRRDWLRHKYSPDQPRVPSGNTGGGRWTSGGGGGGPRASFGLGGGQGEQGEFAAEGDTVFDTGGEESWSSYSEGYSDDGSVFERDITNRDGSTIRSEYAASREAGFDERQTVTLNSGEAVTFETTGREQTIRYGGPDGEVVGRSIWTPSGPERDATVQPAFAPLIAAPGVIALGGAILFNWQSQQNGVDGRQAVMGFNARDFYPGASGRFELSRVSNLTYEDVKDACDRLTEVQSLTDSAARAAGPSSQYPSMAVYGTDVHTRFKYLVEDLKDPGFRAERSYMKELGDPTSQDAIRYGYPSSVRVDAYEYRADGTLCLYDLKTGKRGLSTLRADVLANAAAFGFTGIRRIIVTEVRPGR